MSQRFHPLLRFLTCLVGGLVMLATAHVAALGQIPDHDSKGKIFWVTFIKGEGGSLVSDMRLYLSALVPTQVRITDNRTGRIDTFELTQPYQSYEVDITAIYGGDFELQEFNVGISNKSLYVEADDDITLYGVNVRQWSSDAFLGLPDDVLTRKYILLSYPNGFIRDLSPIDQGEYDHPSEFAVIATEDGTTVTITPTANLNGRPTRQPFTVGLDRGNVFFAQAELDGPQDVSGTEIRSTKPIAVFSGTERTSMPTNVGNFRDLLVEQMPPLESWGTSAIVPPLFDIQQNTQSYQPVVRIVAAVDNTAWRLNGVPQTPMMAGRVVEMQTGESPTVIDADAPILVAQYEHSYTEDNSGIFGLGDPFMMLIPPEVQYDTTYVFQSVPHELFELHLINVVVPTNQIGTLELDGQPVTTPFVQVPNTIYSYAQIEVKEGTHVVRAAAPFGLYSYGYGEANSYGYPGGTLYKMLLVDFTPPTVEFDRVCAEVNGLAIDDGITDTGIDSCYVMASATKNAMVVVEPFTRGEDTVRYRATLNDPYQDGIATVRAIDSGGRSITSTVSIPGFTLGVESLGGGAPLREEVPAYNGESVCLDFAITNYGGFPQKVEEIDLNPSLPTFQLRTPAGFTLMPGETRLVQVCYDNPVDTVVTLSLGIADSCRSREVAQWTVHSITDTTPPLRNSGISFCEGGGSILFEEPTGRFRGIASMETRILVNASAAFTPGTDQLPTSSLALQLTQLDPYQDMMYEVAMTDLAGNEVVYSDTVAGMTVAAYAIGSDEQATVRLDNDLHRDSLDYLAGRCDSVILVNYGARQLILTRGMLLANLDFSIPPAQFPIVIEPQDTFYLEICQEGRYAGIENDTILLIDGCGRSDKIAVQAPVDYGLGSGVDRCGQDLSIRAYAPAKRTFLTNPFPNPSTGESVGIDIGLTTDESVTLELIDNRGDRRLLLVNDHHLEGGIHRLRFDAAGLDNGVYFCRLVTAGGESISTKLMIQR